MSVSQAFSDLMDISSQVEAAIALEEDSVLASSLLYEIRSAELAAAVRALAEAATQVHEGAGLKQLEVSLPEGNVFLVCEGSRLIAATTAPDPASALVFYDLRTCLTALAEAERPSAETMPSFPAPETKVSPPDAAR